MAQTKEQQRLRNRDAQRQHRRRKTEEQGKMKDMLAKNGDYFRAILLAPSIDEARMLALNALAALSEMTPRARGAARQQWPEASRQQEGAPYGGMPYGLWAPLPTPPDDGTLAWWDPTNGGIGHAMESSALVPAQQACWPPTVFGDGPITSHADLQPWETPGEHLISF